MPSILCAVGQRLMAAMELRAFRLALTSTLLPPVLDTIHENVVTPVVVGGQGAERTDQALPQDLAAVPGQRVQVHVLGAAPGVRPASCQLAAR